MADIARTEWEKEGRVRGQGPETYGGRQYRNSRRDMGRGGGGGGVCCQGEGREGDRYEETPTSIRHCRVEGVRVEGVGEGQRMREGEREQEEESLSSRKKRV